MTVAEVQAEMKRIKTRIAKRASAKIKALSSDNDKISKIKVLTVEGWDEHLKEDSEVDNLKSLHKKIALEFASEYDSNGNYTGKEGVYSKVGIKVVGTNGVESSKFTIYVGGNGDFNPFTETLDAYFERSNIYKDELSKVLDIEEPKKYDFDKFNNITTAKEFQDAQSELEDELEEAGVIDDYEEKLTILDKKFAELISKELV